ncbi:MAG TPA: hypothetical protein VK589_08910 [Chryseolinea sp.]|nr:hypothetical protein [Chryseolinea sp.]
MKPISVIVPLFLFLSCNYEPDGEFFVVRPRPDGTGMSIELTDASDTLFVYGNAEIRFNAIVQNKPVKLVRTYLNNEQFGIHYLTSGSVFLYTLGRNNGCYSLRIEIITSSGTGSLADVREKEELKVERTYVLCIDNSKPDPVEITSIRRSDGTLELVWERYPKPNFQKYKILKYCYNQGYHQFETHWIKEITNRQTTTLHDSTFIGGKVKYFLSVIAANQESDGVEKEFDDPYDIDVTSESVDNANIKLTWRRPAYYKNFTSYLVSFAYGSGDDRSFTVTNINDTTLTIPHEIIFAQTKSALVQAYPVRIDNYHPDFVYDYSEDIQLGKNFPWYIADEYKNEGVYNQQLGKYFALQYGPGPTLTLELIRINPVTNEVEQAYEIPYGSQFLLSDNGQYLYVTHGDNFTRLNPLNFSIIQTYDVSVHCGTNSGYNWISSIAGNNRLALSNGHGSFVLDMNNFSLIQQWPLELKTIQISATGTFVVRGNDILKWNSTQYVAAGTLGSARQRIFIQNDAKVLIDKVNKVEVVNLSTMAIERTITLDGIQNLRYDPVSGLIGGISDYPRRFYLYSLTDNEKIKDFPVAGAIVLMNNSLVTPGHILPLSYYYP